MRKLLTILGIVVVMMNLSTVHAAFTIYSDFTSFSAAAGTPLLTQDLETYSDGDDLDGVELLPGLSVTSSADNVTAWDPIATGDVRLFAYGGTRGSYDINLSVLYRAVAFEIDDYDPDAAAYGHGNMVISFADSSTASVDVYKNPSEDESIPIFFGVVSDIPITGLQWNEGPEVGGGGHEETTLDDFTVGQACYPDLPDPELMCNGWEDYIGSDSNPYTRYWLSVANWPEFPDELFEAAPDLPACGLNENASRTWVDIYKEDGTRIYGFCALGEAEDLTGIWYALPRGEDPVCVYITLTDRLCEQEYTSNVVCPQWVDETAWAAGSRYVEKGNWATYTPYVAGGTATLYAGQTMEAGMISFSSNGSVSIMITLNEGWRFADVEENVKIQNYDSEPSGKPRPGKFEHKFNADADVNSYMATGLPLANFYGIQVDVEWLDCAEYIPPVTPAE